MRTFDFRVLIALGGFAMTSWIVYTIVDGIRRWHQQRALSQFQGKLLDKIGSIGELGAFMNSEGGNQFLKSLAIESAPGIGPHARLFRAVQGGCVLVALGTGLFLYGGTHPSLSLDGRYAVDLMATISLTIGIGLLASAAISYRLSLRLGSMNGSSEAARERLPTV
jgi:hypothetical protein